jgi:hypothetical protein
MSKTTNLICPKFEFPISARENRRKRNFPETGSPPPQQQKKMPRLDKHISDQNTTS